jgi:hypothetical protein
MGLRGILKDFHNELFLIPVSRLPVEHIYDKAITDILKLLPKEKKYIGESQLYHEKIKGYNKALKDIKKALEGE